MLVHLVPQDAGLVKDKYFPALSFESALAGNDPETTKTAVRALTDSAFSYKLLPHTYLARMHFLDMFHSKNRI
jgi:hypothetical protein